MSDDRAEDGGVSDIAAGRRRLGLTAVALWIGYFEVGGNGTLAEVEGWLAGASQPSDRDHDMLAQALNDQFVDSGLDHPVPYRLA